MTRERKGSPRRKKKCYICGSEDKKKLTRDHFPPKGFFPNQGKGHTKLLTLNCCKTCNESFSVIDATSRFILLSDPLATKSEAGKTKLSELQKGLKTKRNYDPFLSRMNTWNGEPSLIINYGDGTTGEGDSVEVPVEEYLPFICRTARFILALHDIYMPEILKVDYWRNLIDTGFLEMAAKNISPSKSIFDQNGNIVFSYSITLTPQNTGGIFVFSFYEGFPFYGVFLLEKPLELKNI